MHKLVYFLAGTLVLGASMGYVLHDSRSVTATPTPILANRSTTNKPATKTATISVEGEKTPVTLRLYDQYSRLFTTYYPIQDFVPEEVSSTTGKGVRFIVNFGGTRNDNAYVNVVFPNGVNNLRQLRNLINGKSGLLASNGWQIVSRTRNVPYRYAQEKIVFNKKQDNENITGNIYLGQQNGKAFYVVTHYPVEYSDGFTPRADLIMKNLEVSR
jgi:hypothetical protein